MATDIAIVNPSVLADPTTIVEKTEKPLDIRSQAQVQAINYSLNKKDATRKRPQNDGTAVYTDEQRDSMLKTETEKHLTVKSWKRLDMSFKWQFCKDYIDRVADSKCQRTRLYNYVKMQLLSGGMADVTYSSENKAVERLNVLVDGFAW